MRAIEAAGYQPGDDVVFALDCRRQRVLRERQVRLAGEGSTLDAAGMVRVYEDLCSRYPIVSIEDGMAEGDWDGWKALTERSASKVQLVGDDLFVTNTHDPGGGHLSRASPTRSWSRSTRSAR